MRLEVQHKARNSPVKAVLIVTAVLVLIGGGVGYRMYSQHESELATQRALLARLEAEKAKAEAEYKSQMLAIQKEMTSKLSAAKSEEERARIRTEAAQASAAAAQRRQRRVATPTKGEKDPTAAPHHGITRPGKREISDSPLEGLQGL
jgi:predicted negative regulator of RcsB-dependent stress response